ASESQVLQLFEHGQADCLLLGGGLESEQRHTLKSRLDALAYPCVDIVNADEVAGIQPRQTLPWRQTHEPQAAFYAIYTSGSTGEARLNESSHAAIANLYQWYAQDMHIDQQARCLLLSSPAFDLSQKNIFVTLMQGACLYIAQQDRQDGRRFYDVDAVLDLMHA